MFDQRFPVAFGSPKPPASMPPALVGAGPPTSGPGGTAAVIGQHYQDTSQNPPIIWEKIAADPALNSWLSLQSGMLA